MSATATVLDICVQCAATYERPERSRRRRYCSAVCRKRAEMAQRKATRTAQRKSRRAASGQTVPAPADCPLADADGLVNRDRLAAFERLGGSAGCECCGSALDWAGVFWRRHGGVLLVVCPDCSLALVVLRAFGVDPTHLLLVLTGLDSSPAPERGGGTGCTRLRPDEGKDAAAELSRLVDLGARLRAACDTAAASERDAIPALFLSFRWSESLSPWEAS